MVEQALKEFFASIAPYRKLWGSLRASGATINHEDKWFNVAVRLEFRENAPEKMEMHSPEPHFLHFVVDFPIALSEVVIRELVLGGTLRLQSGGDDRGGAYVDILMKREPPNVAGASLSPVSWSTPIVRDPGENGGHTQQKRTSITLSGYGQYFNELLAPDLARKIETRLRGAIPCYDGLSGLFAHLIPGFSYRGRDNTLLEIIAELPFELRTGDKGTILIECIPQIPADSLSARCFYGPGAGLPPSVVGLQPQNARKTESGHLQWTLRPDWPDRAANARIVLFFEDHEVQTLKVNRWPSVGNLRQMVDAYFDPSQERLKKALLDRGSTKSREFELGVARLLTLLGLPVVWYGEGATEARPDLGGYVENGPALLVECTLEKPSVKFSGLAERAKELQEQIGADADIFAAVFTRAEPVDSEKEQALEYGVVLIGRREIEELLEMLNDGAGTLESLRYLVKIRSELRFELGALAVERWQRPW
jgi:hypothetical protein